MNDVTKYFKNLNLDSFEPSPSINDDDNENDVTKYFKNLNLESPSNTSKDDYKTNSQDHYEDNAEDYHDAYKKYYNNTESGLSRFAKLTGKSISKGIGEAIQSPTELYNLAKYIAGDKDPNEIKTEHEKQFDEDWPMNNQVSLSHLKPLPYLKPELDKKFGKGFESLVGESIEPSSNLEKGYSNLIQEASSWLSPDLISKTGGLLGKLASKTIPKGTKTVQTISSKIPEGVKEVGETVGNIGKGLYNAFYKAPSLTKIATATAAGKISKSGTDLIDDDTEWKRSLKAIIPLIANSAINKGVNITKGKLHKDLIDPKKLDLVNKTGVPAELSQITNASHALTPFLANAAQNIMETPGARINLAKNRGKLLNKIVENLGIDNFDIKRSEDAAKLVQEAYGKYIDESKLKSKELENKALGKINTLDSKSEKNYLLSKDKKSFKSSDTLTPDELQDRIKTFWLNASPDLKSKLLKNKNNLDYNVLDKFMADSLNKKNYTFDTDIDGKREQIKIELSPEESIRPFAVRPSHTQMLLDQNRRKTVPEVVTKFADDMRAQGGYVSFNDLHEYRKEINQYGNSKWARAAKTDVMNFLDTVPKDRKKSYEQYLKFNNERLSNGKKKADEKFIKSKYEESEIAQFDQILKDVTGENILSHRYIKHLSPPAAKNVVRELLGALAFNSDKRSINFDEIVKKVNNLTEDRFKHLSKLYSKAHPNSNLSLRELVDLIDISRATHPYSKSGIYSHATTGKNFMFNTIPEAVAKAPAFLAGNYTGMGKLANVFGKILGPILMGKISTDQLLLNQKHINWISKGNNIKNWGEFNNWLNQAYEHKLISRTDTKLIQKMIEEKKKESETKPSYK